MSASGWEVFSEHDSGVVTVRILSPEGDGVEAILDPAEAREYGADIIAAGAVAQAQREAAIERLESGEEP